MNDMLGTKSPDLNSVISLYRQAFKTNGVSPAAVLMPKGRQSIRFQSLCRYMRRSEFSVLDYGAGLGDLCSYLDRHFTDVRYTGVDIVQEFVDASRERFPRATFRRMGDFTEIEGRFDYVLLAGVFNVLYFDEESRHRDYVCAVLKHLFGLCEGYMAVNFMTDRVDYQQSRAYHQSPPEICAFASRSLSPRWVLDQSYMPYEFTLTVFRDATIVRPDNIYLLP